MNNLTQHPIKKPKPSISETIEAQLSRGATLHEDIEVGSNIKKGITLIKELSSSGFELSQSEKNIIFRYCRSGKPIDLVIPTCPDYLPEESIKSFNDPIIGSEIPATLYGLLEIVTPVISILRENQIPFVGKVLISNPRKAQRELLEIPSRTDIVNEALAGSQAKIQEYLDKIGMIETSVSTFMKDFDYPRHFALEAELYMHLTNLYGIGESFKSQVDRKITTDRARIRKRYEDETKFGNISSFDRYEIEIIIRNFAEYLALGQTLDENIDQPLLVGLAKRTTLNSRNVPNMQLPGVKHKEHRTIPVITKPNI
jgi:hypothetical protein